MEDRLYLWQRRSAEIWPARGVQRAIAISLLTAAIIGGRVLLLLPGTPAPTPAGLRQIPRQVLKPLRTQLEVLGRSYPCEGAAGCRLALTGAVLLARTGRSRRFEVSAEYHYRLAGPPPKGAPVGLAAVSEDYSVFIRQAPRRWQLTSLILLPEPQAHQG